MAELNGTPVSSEDLQTLALTNYGHFTSMRCDDGVICGLSLHMERLVRDSRLVFGADLDPERVLGFVRQAVSGRTGSFNIRITAFDTALEMGHPGADAQPQVLVTTRPSGEMPPQALRAKTYAFSRDTPAVKHIGLFSQLKLRRQAQLEGFDDAIFVEPDGQVSEGVTWNLGFVAANGTVVWPAAPVLPGVTMQLLQDAHKQTEIRPVLLSDLSQMRAAFATNTSIGVRGVTQINDIAFPEQDPVLDELRRAYADLPDERL
ncbi:aminotransferase class IV family protein [Streptomyces sp. H27-G5]|uniref:aminotransferase class IV family protein n=1 Tax=Streptomyces sp. H27-G5 TaxID=2996698 RepID=UPI00226D817B|nr:aminotransferase class IV family protein [Streptomyces sp. H27-G5]MCY0922860.1 aminotransferase class IV family protein [Streptomyces sp. H27-G5]